MHGIIRIAVAVLVAVPLLAADLGKHKEWGSSPQAYFLTNDERKQWEAVTTEAQAATFIEEFLARRDAGFAAEVAKRTEMADKYLTLADRPGSRTLRGKVVVLFGPPAGLTVDNRAKTSSKRDNPIMAGALSNAGSYGTSKGKADDSTTPTGGAMSTSQGVRTYSITFSGDAIARMIDKQAITFVIDADPTTGKDEWASRSAGKEAAATFEQVARASIVKK